jgi:hypothetical protein
VETTTITTCDDDSDDNDIPAANNSNDDDNEDDDNTDAPIPHLAAAALLPPDVPVPHSTAAALSPLATVANEGSIINPCVWSLVLQGQLLALSTSDNPLPLSLLVQFWLNDNWDDNFELKTNDLFGGASKGAVILGTQLTPFDALTAAHCSKAGGNAIEPLDIVGINPLHKRWIHLSLLDDWGILYPHEFQICLIHNIAFHCNQIIYLIAKMGSGKLAVLLTIGSLQTGVMVTMIPLVGLGSKQVENGSNVDNLIKAYHLDKHHGNEGKALSDRLLFFYQMMKPIMSLLSCTHLPNSYWLVHFGIRACQLLHCVIW